MSTGAKIAVGCGIVLLVAIIGVGVAVVGGAYWVKGKAETLKGEQDRIEALKKTANENSFERPADGLVREDRLVKFLDVRKRVFAVYEKHEATIQAMKNKEQADFSDVRQTYNVINELRLALAQAQADLAMSDDEYEFLVEQVYKSMWAAEVSKATGGKSVSEAAGEMYEKAAREMERAAAEAEAERKRAGAEKDDAASAESEKALDRQEEAAGDASRDMKKAAEDMKEQAEKVREDAGKMDVPPANIALFQKYESEIKRYAMSGLEWVGL